jgi:hypothetical protein
MMDERFACTARLFDPRAAMEQVIQKPGGEPQGQNEPRDQGVNGLLYDPLLESGKS